MTFSLTRRKDQKMSPDTLMTTKMAPSTPGFDDKDEVDRMNIDGVIINEIHQEQQQEKERGEQRHGSINEDSTNDYELYNYPKDVTPHYRPISLWIECMIVSFSCALQATFTALSSSSSVSSTLGSDSKLIKLVHEVIRSASKKKIILSIFQLALSWLVCRTFVQDAFYSPSRIPQPWKNLKPCSLSHHATISTATLPSSASTRTWKEKSSPSNNEHSNDSDDRILLEPLGVHYVKYDNPDRTAFHFDALHCNHGFGASSLSWLPALPSLTKVAKAPFGLAHDCVGFGLTERPLPTSRQLSKNSNLLLPYTSAGNAAIGKELLRLQTAPHNHQDDKDNGDKSVVLMGHSMGCVATLQMALNFIPRETKKLVILVAPALLLSKSTAKTNPSTPTTSRIRKMLKYIIESQPSQKLKVIVQLFYSFLRSVILDAPLSYTLKRIGSNRKFWKNGLSVAWGDQSLLKQSDILRFEWPSVCQNWIPGILNFARTRLFYQNNSDLDLLQHVVSLPDTKVVFVHGTRDNVIPVSLSQKIIQQLSFDSDSGSNEIDLVLLEGRGHDPFEENVDEFAKCFQLIVDKFKDEYSHYE